VNGLEPAGLVLKALYQLGFCGRVAPNRVRYKIIDNLKKERREKDGQICLAENTRQDGQQRHTC
jgi:hypothetical protein